MMYTVHVQFTVKNVVIIIRLDTGSEIWDTTKNIYFLIKKIVTYEFIMKIISDFVLHQRLRLIPK
jgi:hypothetical protein